MSRTLTTIVFCLALGVSAAYAVERTQTDFMKSVIKITGPLRPNEFELAEYTMAYYIVTWKKDLSAFTDDEWNCAVIMAAKKAKSSPLNTLMKIGKWGEKFLKTTIVVTEDMKNNLDHYIEEKSRQYDADTNHTTVH